MMILWGIRHKHQNKQIAAAIFLVCFLLYTLFSPGRANAGYYDYSDTLLIVNDNSPDISVAIGNYFLAHRSNFDPDNVVHINTAAAETISRANYNDQIKTPIENFISSHGLGGTINYIILTKGIPIRITDTNNSVDSELAWCLGKSSCSGLSNPFYNTHSIFSQQTYNMYEVTRLDGYAPDGDLSQIEAIIDHSSIGAVPSVATIKSTGKFVLDGGGLYDSSANPMLEAADALLTEKGFQTILDKTSAYLKATQNVIGYWSWGSNSSGCSGAGCAPGDTYLNGAIGETAVSTSARSFSYPTSYGQSLIADWIAEGVSGIKGYVSEPGFGAVGPPRHSF